MEKTKQDSNVVPFRGYLYPEAVPSAATPQKQTTTPYITIAALLFVAGLALGAISNSSTNSQVEQMKLKVEAQAKQLSTVKKTVCSN